MPADDDAAFLEFDLIAACEYPSAEAWEIDFDDEARWQGADSVPASTSAGKKT